MDKPILWSLRLGFSANQAKEISDNGISGYLQNALSTKIDTNLPSFLVDVPKSPKEIKQYRKKIKKASSSDEKKRLKRKIINPKLLKFWWIDKIKADKNPLREKMVCFWHNHFVATAQKVKLNYWVYQHHMILQQHAFGNYKTLTKAIIKSNAMVRYLDNTDNRKGKINENLSRELLELFTLGIGNYTEEDIRNGAKALAGLHIGKGQAIYKKRFEINEEITYLGKTGVFKVDDLIDIIFEQPNTPYHITRKILQWFVYDTPSEELVTYYGDYFKSVNFEIQPFIEKIFTEEYKKPNAGTKIKDPLSYIMQLLHELQLTNNIETKVIASFLRQQSMDLFNQPNVKGWEGGKSWLTSQTYLQRNQAANLLCNGRMLKRKKSKGRLRPKITLPATATDAPKIVLALENRLLFSNSEEVKNNMIQLLAYDFDPKSKHAQERLLRLVNYIFKKPEFQIV